jgi:transcriptional regulator with XRE-family HTH domain
MTGPELRARRKALGLSQAALAQRLGLPRNTLARWEREELRIEHDEVLDLALQRLEQSQHGN